MKPRKPMTDAHREAIRAWWTPAPREAAAARRRGAKMSEATKQKIRDWWTPERRITKSEMVEFDWWQHRGDQ